MTRHDRKRVAHALGVHEHTVQFWVSDLTEQRREQRRTKAPAA